MSVTLTFNISSPTLYETGFLITDLFHLVLASELLENKRSSEVDDLYFDSERRYRHPSRYDLLPYFEEFHERLRIEKLGVSSIEIALPSLGIAASVIVPLAVLLIERRLNAKDRTIYFNVRSDDQRIHDFLRFFEENGVGSPEAAAVWMRDYILGLGLGVTASSENVFTVIDHTMSRMQSTLETVYQIQKKR
jgi:hypothetical protein